jgi:DNA-binding transcriptional MerR regulator/methylmalonyl-CoA mutase cobalamin-binding subunit
MVYHAQTMYTIKEASARSGVGIPLLRAWERRYGVVAPRRTPSGYRLYDEDAIQRLSAMRHLIDAGWAPQQAASRIRTADADELATLGADARQPAPGLPPSVRVDTAAHEALVDRIVDAARKLDQGSLDAALDETMAAVGFEAAWDRVLAPALRAIGDAWQRGEITVAGEHGTSEAIGRRLSRAFDAASVGAGQPVLVGLAPGARHEFGALAFAVAARRAGMPVLYLGPDLPADSWASAAVERQASAAVVGVPRRADVARGREVIEQLRRARPEMIVAVGGSNADQVGDGARTLPHGSLDASVRALQEALG